MLGAQCHSLRSEPEGGHGAPVEHHDSTRTAVGFVLSTGTWAIGRASLQPDEPEPDHATPAVLTSSAICRPTTQTAASRTAPDARRVLPVFRYRMSEWSLDEHVRQLVYGITDIQQNAAAICGSYRANDSCRASSRQPAVQQYYEVSIRRLDLSQLQTSIRKRYSTVCC